MPDCQVFVVFLSFGDSILGFPLVRDLEGPYLRCGAVGAVRVVGRFSCCYLDLHVVAVQKAARCVLRDVERDVRAAKGIGGSRPDALSADEELDVGIGRGICGGDVSCQSHTIALYLDVGSQCLEEEIADVGCVPVVG